MRAKTPRRSLRYLLYADRTLQRLTLRRLSVRAKKTNKPSGSSRAKKNGARETNRSRNRTNVAPVVKTSRFPQAMDPWWVAFGAVCVAGIVALVGVPSSSQRSDRRSAAMQSEENAPQEDASMTPMIDIIKPAPGPSTKTAARTRTDAPTVGARTVESSRTPTAETTTNAHPAANATGQNAFVTIQGCLQPGNDTFWLKDTSGADAPKSRSWRSGFLKKRSAPVEIVDAAGALNFSKYVGQRVAASGTVSDRRMQAYSLQRVAASCE